MNRRDLLKTILGAGAVACIPLPVTAAAEAAGLAAPDATGLTLAEIESTIAKVASVQAAPFQHVVEASDAYIPEAWAQEGLAILRENMVVANLVHRDFENEVAKYGDVINFPQPSTFQFARKSGGLSLVNTPIQLDQWFYSSFIIKDGEASRSFAELAHLFLIPSMQAMARGVDQAILEKLSTRLADRPRANDILDARQMLNVNKTFADHRHLVVSPMQEINLLKNQFFVKGYPHRGEQHGRILGFDTVVSSEAEDSFAFHRDAVVLANRPLQTPSPAMGIASHVTNHDGLSLRAAMQYDCLKQGTVVNIDILAGADVISPEMCVALAG